MDPRIAVTIGNEKIPVRPERYVGRIVERAGGVIYRAAIPADGTGVRGLVLCAQGQFESAIFGEAPDRVVSVIDTVYAIVRTHPDAVSAGEYIGTPGIQQAAISVEDHHRMVATAEYVQTIFRVYIDTGDLVHDPASRNLGPALEDFVPILVCILWGALQPVIEKFRIDYFYIRAWRSPSFPKVFCVYVLTGRDSYTASTSLTTSPWLY